MSARLTVRMASPSILISLLLLALGSAGGLIVQRMQRQTAKTVSLDMATIQAAEQLVFAIGETRMELAEFLATADAAHLGAVPATCAHIKAWLEKTGELVDDDQERALAGKLDAGYQDFMEQWRNISSQKSSELRPAVMNLNDLAARGLFGARA